MELASQLIQGLAGYPENGPFIHGNRRYGPVKVYGRLVPIQDPPLQTSAASLTGKVAQLREHAFAQPFAPKGLFDKKVLKVDAGLAQKR